ncbi:MAG TPA: UbiD family decarboxylase [Anaerolineae bacterium]|nr:MAG: hypothetical protein A3G83_16555 [Betaproteobacteria bacterium RIFCSPLOWO2_12_FULL_68_20]HKZ85984.1 UbiD family decarboxylase [Anaerolineae bacterium]
MRREHLSSLRSTLAWLGDEVKYLRAEVDPVLEMTAINKAFDDGPVFVAENITGYSHARYVASLFGRRDRVCRLLGVQSQKEAAQRILEALRHPVAPVIVSDAPCQEIVTPGKDVDPFALFPMVKHTPVDGGRFFGSGVHLIGGKYADGKSQLAFYRMSFRGRDFASINMFPGGHGDQIAQRHFGEKIPCTVNICPPPMVEFVAGGSLNPIIFPTAPDELGLAGALQGAPVELVRARTVDAYAIARSEWVIEGYIVTNERVWETEEAEELGVQGKAMFHPEYAGYVGRAYRCRKFEVTAVTHRADKPYYYVPYFGNIWAYLPFVSANYLELCERIAPGFALDATSMTGLITWGGVIIQVKKRRATDEGLQRNILTAAMGISRGLRLVVVVDEDVDIYQPESVLWAIATRVDPKSDVVIGGGGRGQAFVPSAAVPEGKGTFGTCLGVDATVPWSMKDQFARTRYPVDAVDFSKWFTAEEIRSMREHQSEYLRHLGMTGFS